MSDWFLVALLILVVYRMAQLFVYDDGPLDLLFTLRTKLGVYELDHNGEPDSNLGKLFACPYCLGFWLAIPAALVVSQTIRDFVILWFAIAGGQTFLEGVSDGKR